MLIPEMWISIALSIPLVLLLGPSIPFWKSYRIEKMHQSNEETNQSRKADYNQPLFGMFVCGVFGMWIFWIIGIFFSFFNSYQAAFIGSIITIKWSHYLQICGLGFFFLGGFGYNWVLRSAGKYVQPAPSGALEDHRLITTGPYGVVRHPLYISYVCILIGLLFILRTYWVLLPLFLVLVGIKSTARAEEIVLIIIFGEQYFKYQEEVGMLLLKIKRS
jgi:protein-S-isoprenylcysteine O-methyltransferase Ste14